MICYLVQFEFLHIYSVYLCNSCQFIFSILVHLQVLMELLATSVHKATELTPAMRQTQELKRYLWMTDEGGGS